MNIAPIRLQLRRFKGFNLQALSRETNGREAVNCARPSRWGNPCRVGQFKGYSAADAVADFRRWLAREPCVRSFENVFGKPPATETIIAELRGKNLACFCAPGAPCHVDVLLEIANR